MKHLFSECEEIDRKNRKRRGYSSLKSWVVPKSNNYLNKPPPRPPCKKLSIQKEYTYCRDCGCVLEKKASRFWGICPSCDMK
jgi:hypothetical protein